MPEEYILCKSCGRSRICEYFDYEGDHYYECSSGHCWCVRPEREDDPRQWSYRSVSPPEPVTTYSDVQRSTAPAWRAYANVTSTNALTAEMMRRWSEQVTVANSPPVTIASTPYGPQQDFMRNYFTTAPASIAAPPPPDLTQPDRTYIFDIETPEGVTFHHTSWNDAEFDDHVGPPVSEGVSTATSTDTPIENPSEG